MRSIFQHLGLGLLTALLLTSCEKDACEGGCVTVQGRLVTGNGQEPLKSFPIQVEWFEGYGFFGRTDVRLKAVAVTDANGNYLLRYQFKDEEVRTGYLRATLDERYYYGAQAAHVPLPRQRSATVVAPTAWLPRPAQLVAAVANPEAMQQNDRISVELHFVPLPATAAGSDIGFSLSGTSQSSTRPVPAEQQIRITARRYRGNSPNPFSTTADSLLLARDETRRYLVRF